MNRVLATVLTLALSMVVCGCGSPNTQAKPSETPAETEVHEQTVGDITQSMTDDAATQMETELSAFEITAAQRELAKDNAAGYEVLDAGRGNPNWINAKARYAYARLMEFACTECQRDMDAGDMAGQGTREGVYERFLKEMDAKSDADSFLLDAVAYCQDQLGMDPDALLAELTDGIIGDYYPSPSRCLTYTETILNEYLESVLYKGKGLKGETQVFPTEGGSAAMCYIFQSLVHNHVLEPGDNIAIATPIFTPYLEIPNVNNYGLVSVAVTSGAEEGWDISEEELGKLEDPSIKAFFLVNPSNPASRALSDETLARIAEVVERNPDLIILTDDVYGSFVDDFTSVYGVAPHNTILVYSFSKLYGATGWRCGLIAMNEDNVVDRLIAGLPEEARAHLAQEYSIVVPKDEDLPFIERLCADSRSIGLYHTSGLATPSQVFMDLLCLTHLVCDGDDPYIEQSKELVAERYEALMGALGLPADDSRENARYYAIVDVNALIESRYGADFCKWRTENISDIDLLDDLAREKGVVLMYGLGFEAPEGSVRVSLANLERDDYVELARRLTELTDEYHERYLAEVALAEAA